MTTADNNAPSLAEPLDCIALAPHPDDAELCCGGLLALLAARGYRVGVIDLTAGELASQGTPQRRAEESARAAEILGLAWRENLLLPDGGLDAGDEVQIAALVAALRRTRPEMVLAPYEAARHPDHEAASALASRAFFFAGLRRYAPAEALPAFRPRVLVYYQMRVLFTPSFVVDISAHAAAKRSAIAAHASQLERDPAAVVAGPASRGQTGTLISSAATLDHVDARDRTAGALIGVSHGEPYYVRQTLGVADPLAFFREASEPALFPTRDRG